MELLYLWIKHYKNLENFEVQLNPKYNVEFNKKNFSIHISKQNDFNIFGENINIMALAGKNGCGKSNIINVLKSILDKTFGKYPKENFKYLLILKSSRKIYILSTDDLTKKILSKNPELSVYKHSIKSVLFRQFYRSEDFRKNLSLDNSAINNYKKLYNEGCFYYDRFQRNEVFFALAKMYSCTKENNLKCSLLEDNPHLNFESFRIYVDNNTLLLNQKRR